MLSSTTWSAPHTRDVGACDDGSAYAQSVLVRFSLLFSFFVSQQEMQASIWKTLKLLGVQHLDTSRLLYFFFSYLSIPFNFCLLFVADICVMLRKLRVLSQKRDACGILDFSAITCLRKYGPDFSNRFCALQWVARENMDSCGFSAVPSSCAFSCNTCPGTLRPALS